MSEFRAALAEGFILNALLERTAREPGPANQTTSEIHRIAPVTGWSTQFSGPHATENITQPFKAFHV